jgi:hypothetical protein
VCWGANTEFFLEGADCEAVYNLCLILKIVLQTSRDNCNSGLTLYQLHMYTHNYNYVFNDSLT